MPNRSEFITHFEVSNFKKFDHLVVEDIGQFNLITGDNNVGKTTLLDLLTLNLSNYSKLIFLLHRDLCQRGIHHHFDTTFSASKKSVPEYNYFEEFSNIDNAITLSFNNGIENRNIRIILNKIVHLNNSTEYLQENRYKGIVSLDISNYILSIYENDKLVNTQFLYQDDIDKAALKYSDFIDFLYVPIVKLKHLYLSEDQHRNDVNDMYKNISANGQEEVLQNSRNIAIIVNFMKFIIPDIKGIGLDEKRGLIFVNRTSNGENPEYITKFGDGVQKSLRYIIELLYAKSKNYNYFCIDEIDTGIHFSNMKELWRNILTICEELKIQLFATTHSQECIEAYAQALEELGLEIEGRLIELEEYNGKVYASTLSIENVKAGLLSQTNLRGA